MKKQLLTVLVLLCSLQGFAKGGESGGGGNLVGTPKHAAEVIMTKYLFFMGPQAISEVMARLSGESIFTIDDPRVKKIYQDILNLREFQFSDIKVPEMREIHVPPNNEPAASIAQAFLEPIFQGLATAIGEAADMYAKEMENYNEKNKRLKIRAVNGDCHDVDGKPAIANYIKGTRNPIQVCMSISRLKILPEDVLRKEIVNIMVHELSHAAGYGEADARLAQKYFRQVVARPCVFYATLYNPKSEAQTIKFSYRTADRVKVSVVKNTGSETTGLISVENDQSPSNGRSQEMFGTINWEGDSHISFKYPDLDGTTRFGFIKFNSYLSNDSRVTTQEMLHTITDSYIVIGGKKLQTGYVEIKKGCLLDREDD